MSSKETRRIRQADTIFIAFMIFLAFSLFFESFSKF